MTGREAALAVADVRRAPAPDLIRVHQVRGVQLPARGFRSHLACHDMCAQA